MPKVSVIIPNYNHAAFLQQRIDSVLNQTFQDFEIILLDDCSTDNSRDIIEKYRSCNKVSNIIYNDANSGNTFLQWEKGIALAKGEYIWIAESDDWCENTFLDELIPPMINDLQVVLSYCQSICVNDNNMILGVGGNNKLFETIEGKDFVLTNMSGSNAVYNASMAIFRKYAIVNLSCNYKNLRYCGDWLFWSELAMNGRVFMSGKCLNYFRKHGGDVSSKAIKRGLFFLESKYVFNFIESKLNVELSLVPKVFNFRIEQYVKYRKTFENESILKSVRIVLMSMDKNFKRHVFAYRAKNKLVSIINKFFKLL